LRLFLILASGFTSCFSVLESNWLLGVPDFVGFLGNCLMI